jgi:hypothetical protein
VKSPFSMSEVPRSKRPYSRIPHHQSVPSLYESTTTPNQPHARRAVTRRDRLSVRALFRLNTAVNSVICVALPSPVFAHEDVLVFRKPDGRRYVRSAHTAPGRRRDWRRPVDQECRQAPPVRTLRSPPWSGLIEASHASRAPDTSSSDDRDGPPSGTPRRTSPLMRAAAPSARAYDRAHGRDRRAHVRGMGDQAAARRAPARHAPLDRASTAPRPAALAGGRYQPLPHLGSRDVAARTLLSRRRSCRLTAVRATSRNGRGTSPSTPRSPSGAPSPARATTQRESTT